MSGNTPHAEAWSKIREQLLGDVCEVVRRKPWGFYMDRPDIITKTVDEFLLSSDRFSTVLMHILSGEGETLRRIDQVLTSAYHRAVKIIVLEHSPGDPSLTTPVRDLGPVENMIDGFGESVRLDNWGRNRIYYFSTLHPLELPEISDGYLSEHIDRTFVNRFDHGICRNNLVYTHTSESPIDFELPAGLIYWIIGGGIPFESMRSGNRNILVDAVLRQCIHAARFYGVPAWKLDRIYREREIDDEPSGWPARWRRVRPNGIRPAAILHKSLEQLEARSCSIYVSTVAREHWKHLEADNNILEAVSTPRDRIKIKWKL